METKHSTLSGKAGTSSNNVQAQPNSVSAAAGLPSAQGAGQTSAPARAPMRMSRSHPGRSISDSRG
ncbi:hypothetical protein ACO0LO_14565 [Undibacterium sp. TJN25]|uniref:hypothetical protein n=1 Tax=Undibacterium sp. TJN25 TaxID=3413056 RepID=UPI003BF29793